MFEVNELNGSLFRNKFKEAGSKQPDYRGSTKINGVLYDIAGWVKKDRNDKDYLSLKFQIPRENTGATTTTNRDAETEELPF